MSFRQSVQAKNLPGEVSSLPGKASRKTKVSKTKKTKRSKK